MINIKVEGFAELDEALGELPKTTARNVLKRVAIRALEPMRDTAIAKAPDDPGGPAADLKKSIIISAKVKNTAGNAAFAAAMRGGGSKADAVSAMRGARRAAKGTGSFVEMHVGPKKGRNSKVGSLQEFGTAHHAAQPFMRPAYDMHKGEAVGIIRADLGGEIMKAAERLAKKKARSAAKALKG